MNSNFIFLQTDYPELLQLAKLGENYIESDPNASLFKIRLFTEKLSNVIAKLEGYDDILVMTQVNRITELKDSYAITTEVSDYFHAIRKSGNKAAHNGSGSTAEAKYILKKALKIAQWFYISYEDAAYNPRPFEDIVLEQNNSDYIQQLEADLKQAENSVSDYKDKVKALSLLSEEEKVERKTVATKRTHKSEETEAETRERIDQQLRLVGWDCDTNTINYKSCKTLPEKGKNKAIAEWKCGRLWADYALFIGLELVGIIEAKKHNKNVMSDLNQAKKYSQEVLELNSVQFVKHNNSTNYKVPFLFSTNGRPYLEQMKEVSGIWFWDARNQKNQSKALSHWFSPQDLQERLVFDENDGAEKLAATPYDLLTDPNGLRLREYQVEAIKAVEDNLLNNPDSQRALLAMATGTGKTRTTIGLCYRLIEAKRFKRILFLVDRRMLGNQAADSFKEVKIESLQTFAQIYDLQDLNDSIPELDTKVHFATVQSLVHRLLYSDNPPSVGAYDCIIVDEAHRGYTLDKEMDDEELILRDQLDFQSKYRMVLDHFDAYRIGLTATPATHTAEIFGNPVYNYSYRRAVVEGYLIDFEPPVEINTKLAKDGITWEQGEHVKIYDVEDNEIKDSGITDDEIKVEIQGFNRRVINDSFNRTVLKELIGNPKYALHPDDPKKTLIFAATDLHADMIVKILKEEFAEMGEDVEDGAIEKITGAVYDRDQVLKRYKNEQYPSIVVTVDLLTTGIDIPRICNLVFMRRVNSRILYDQMMGRATRQCPEIGKDVFKVYDAVGVSQIMAKEKVMKPVAPLVTKTFAHLSEEIALVEDEYIQQRKLERIIAKLQRKVRGFNEEQMESFSLLSGEDTVKDFAETLTATEPSDLKQVFDEKEKLWDYLDHQKPKKIGYGMLYSEHVDELLEATIAYSKNLKPKDYIESFNDFIKNNINELAALNVVCNTPSILSRKDLKDIRLHLNEAGYDQRQLNAAHKETTNQDIAADIISHIRRAALGNTLISHEDRITNAVTRVKESQEWNTIQLKWLERIEKQLLQESILTVDDLNKPPFSNDGGRKRLDKVFKNQTETIINTLNNYLYLQA